MRWVWGAALVLVVLGGWFVQDALRRPPSVRDRGPSGIDFMIPGSYRVLRLGESDLTEVAAAVLDSLQGTPRIASEFTHSGDRIQLLVDEPGEKVEVRVASREGTVRLELWSGPVTTRLRWARETGRLDAPGLPGPERRNPYH